MARLRVPVESEDDLPDPSSLLHCSASVGGRNERDPNRAALVNQPKDNLQSQLMTLSLAEQQAEDSDKGNQCFKPRRSPRKPVVRSIDYAQYAASSGGNSPSGLESSFDEAVDYSGITSSSESSCDSCTEPLGLRSAQKEIRNPSDKNRVDLLPRQLFPQVPRLPLMHGRPTSKRPTQSGVFSKGQDSRPPSSDSGVQPSAVLRFSPPPAYSPHKYQPSDKLVTPPASPCKPRLQSPTKQKPKIPPTPHRPSIDAFWNAEVVNQWHDVHSPRKPSKTGERDISLAMKESEGSGSSPLSSPRKGPLQSPLKSPTKKDKTEVQRKKDFDSSKHDIAKAFLDELDERLACRKIASLTASTGGIKILWSRKLNSTAGRANWKRESIRSVSVATSSSNSSSSSSCSLTPTRRQGFIDLTASPQKSPQRPTSETTYRHHASIELATKVISTHQQLLNVLAHEFCHLCTFMISHVKNNPHGKEFKSWAKKASNMFQDRGVQVTTKHSYEIDYRYIWLCAGRKGQAGDEGGCGLEYKRHSKSIDPDRQGCGKCKGRLLQVKPVPRATASTTDSKASAGGDYRAFVKMNYSLVKADHPSLGMGEIMKEVARRFREGKASKQQAVTTGHVSASVTTTTTTTRNDSGEKNDDVSHGSGYGLLDDIEKRMVDLTV